jgi:Ala-tRNA(Pro) deacylase
MSVSSQLNTYLAQRGARYEICIHEHSLSSAETARRAGLAGGQVAKPVILEDDEGCVMAIVPADKTLKVEDFARLMGRDHLELAKEERIARLFTDCERGAIPPVGMAWGIPTIVDDDLEQVDVVYMEAGDHERLLRMSHDQFHSLMQSQPHGNFSRAPMH